MRVLPLLVGALSLFLALSSSTTSATSPTPGTTDWALLAVTDLDTASIVIPDGALEDGTFYLDPSNTEWRAILRQSTLTRVVNDDGTASWSIGDLEDAQDFELRSKTATKGRAMELSELIYWNGALLAPCDVTGIIYKLSLISSDEVAVFRRFAVASGSGKDTAPFKHEWALIKDDSLWLGSLGKEWIDDKGTFRTNSAEWVKTIDSCGTITNINWGEHFTSLRVAAGTQYPGYLTHESALWHPTRKVWIFAPRRISFFTTFSERADQQQGNTNVVLVASEDFSDIDMFRINLPAHPEWGFSSLKLVPGTDSVFVAMQVRELGPGLRPPWHGRTAADIEAEKADPTIQQSRLLVFDLDSTDVLAGPVPWSDSMKFEGVEVLPTDSPWFSPLDPEAVDNSPEAWDAAVEAASPARAAMLQAYRPASSCGPNSKC